MTEQSNEPDRETTKLGRKGLKRVFWATYYSRGIRAALKNEAAFRQELALMLVLIPLAF